MNNNRSKKNTLTAFIVPILFLIILAVGVYFRFRGLFWGEYLYLHPDERFLVWVGSSIESVNSIGEYFNTHLSSLNPHNRGHGFFVYGDFPIIFTRYIAEGFFEFVGWNEITQVGRVLSSLFDLGSVVLIFMIGWKLFNKWVGLLASAFSAFAVLQIQQSHFYTVDTFATFFTTLAIFIAVLITNHRFDKEKTLNHEIIPDEEEKPKSFNDYFPFYKLSILSIIFGIVVGLAAASKINTVTISLLLPIAFLILWNKYPVDDPSRKTAYIFRDLVLGGFFALLSFRIFQPYAFEGPGFFGLQINELWLNNLREVSAQSSGKVDFPPALQWARRGFLFSAKNITLWGLGLPLSIFVWSGMLTMGWRIVRGEWNKYSLVWFWTVGYFLWQSSLGNSVMRYQLPIYPMLGLLAAWFIHFLYTYKPSNVTLQPLFKIMGLISLFIAVSGSVIWAYMFSSIYEEPITRVEASRWIYENVPGPINMIVENDGYEQSQKIISFPYEFYISDGNKYSSTFTMDSDSFLKRIYFTHIQKQGDFEEEQINIFISITDQANSNVVFEKAVEISIDGNDLSGAKNDLTIFIEPTLTLNANQSYEFTIKNEGIIPVTFLGSAPANESSWDDGLPLRTDGYDAYGGIYQKDLTFEMYWEDNSEKLDRFISTLNTSDYIFISSNRQWGTTTRVPERYPLTTQFYKSLLGCPYIEDLYTCYSEAKPGMYQGELGFDLVKVFESYPQIGNFKINDQYADEAFTVYDHPKVMIFKKSDDFNLLQVSNILGSVDLNKVIYFTPGEFPDYPANLELPAKRLENQRASGTWSELFDTSNFVNRSPFLAVVFWYIVILLLGWLLYPITRLAFNGLIDKGYAFSKLFAILLISLIVWLGGSFGISVSRAFISFVVGFILIVSLLIGLFTKEKIIQEIKLNKNLLILVESLSLLLFVAFLLVRLGNSDLWHPSKGGEKPMDFSYLNAVIKSSTFPPYDPWYAGGYINYYYYGFVIVGILIKWLGIVPSIAYNIVLPTLFSFVGIGAFSIVWNLVYHQNETLNENNISTLSIKELILSKAGKAGIAGLLFTVILGNLGTIRMIWHGLQRIGSPAGVIEGARLFERFLWTFQGISKFIKGQNLPFYPGDWYWVPSRALPQEPITEFPFFTFPYADLHAHMIAMPITIMAIAWALSILISKWKFTEKIPEWFTKLIILIAGAITIGALRPTNTWDFPTYLVIGIVTLTYTIFRFGKGFRTSYQLNTLSAKIIELVMLLTFFIVTTFILYKPFYNWYGQAYTQIELWKGSLSPFWSYFTHWGFFLVILFTWLLVETTKWMAETPLSSARKLLKYKFLLWISIAAVVGLTIFLLIQQINIAWLVFPMAAWCGVLLLRKELDDSKKFVLFLTGSALVLTLMVEIVVLKGDIGRMNTVFKFYLQAWILFAISSGAALMWSISEIKRHWSNFNQKFWRFVLLTLFVCTALYPITAGLEKINDRMSSTTPRTLDGMKFMLNSFYYDEGVELDLSEDYRAIRWLQENVIGSPVIVEANTVEYKWGSRYSMYTGLPGVVGWNWHQRQQRGILPSNWVTDRVEEVNNFYLTTDYQVTKEFIDKYDVSYIIVGQLERAKYFGEGIGKFPQLEGKLWQSVFEEGNTIIYEVLEQK